MVRAQSDAVAHGALRIDVREEGLHAAPCERRREIYGGRRLADTAFLADYGENSSHSLFRAGVRGSTASDLLDGLPRVLHPAFGFGRRRRMLQKRGQVTFGALAIPALEQQIRESVVRAAQLRIDFECTPIAADRSEEHTSELQSPVHL